MKSISPFSSSVPYAQDIQPTLPKPEISEIPAFKPKPKPEVSVSEKPEAPPAPATAPPPPVPAAASPAAPAPSASEAPQSAPVPAPPAAPAAPQSQSSAAPAMTSKTAEAEAPASKPAKAGESSEDTEVAGGGEKKPQPTLPEADRTFQDDGTYPNLAQVPSRPVNMPTFAQAKALEKALVADAGKAKDQSQSSPEAPSVDSSPVPVNKLVKPAAAPASALTAAADRPEDSAPCLGKPAEGKPTATVNFDPGSAAIDTARLQALVEAMPSIRAATGTIRIFGHGDPGADSAGSGRFDLAVARANAVAQAVAGYGIPAPRIAVGVACSDAALGGSSVQLYAES